MKFTNITKKKGQPRKKPTFIGLPIMFNICQKETQLTMQQINQIIRQVAVEAVTKENIITYLEVVKNNLNLSVLNQAMVYLQRPKAKHVCGRKAWEDIGRKIKPHTTPIVLFFPSIKNDDETTSVYSEYIPINTYDLDSTEGDDINTSVEKDIHFVETIIEITGIAPETADIPKTEMVKGLYDTKTNSFYFSNDISLDTEYGRNEYNKAALSIYTDYIFENYKLQDKSLRAAIKYVLFEHYGFTHCIEKPAFRKLDKMSELEKIDFITELQFFTNCITQDFDGY